MVFVLGVLASRAADAQSEPAATPPASASVVSAPPASAPRESTPPATAAIDPEGELQQLFDDALALLRDGRPSDALPLLERARALRELPAVLYNLALAQRGAGRLLDGITSLRRYFVITEGRLDPARRADVEALMTGMQRNLAHAVVQVRGVGVAVSIDGHPVPRSALDAPIPVDPGVHVFRGDGDGLRAQEVRYTIAPQRTQSVLLEPERIRVVTALSISASVPSAEILVDALVAGTGHAESQLRPGTHHVQVHARGYAPYATSIALRTGQIVTIRAQLLEDRPLVTRWWLWTGVGSATAIALIAGIWVASGSPTDGFVGNTGSHEQLPTGR